jgi:integrase
MTGSVQHLGADRYRVIVYAGTDERTGREKYRSRSFRADGIQKARKAATKIADALLDEIADGKVVRGTLAGYVDVWLKENQQTKSPTTMTGYRQIAGVIVAEFGRMKIDELRPRDVRAWYARLAAGGMTQATIRHYHAVLNAICRQAWADGEVTKPATFGVKLPKANRQALELPTEQAMMVALSHATGDLQVALRLAVATGMRRGELLALRWSDLHGTELHVERALIELKGVVQSKSTKGKRGRVVALDHETMRMLTRHRTAQVASAKQLGYTIDKRADRALLANLEADPSGQTPYPPTWLSHGWARVRSSAGLPSVRLHDLRHRHATTLLDSGVPIHVVSPRLGHATVTVTLDIYAHADRPADRAAARVIGQAMKALKP